ncbi:hypothetical protein B5M09_012482 [Aphanomyces astaci]|uniref:Uncharacterized protein n=1 Tax=Aphanomyces astaci TaxID=112090 RepID=A0A3R7YIC7_APHAT|nr:hypothetical protein B5M09_012482 [Aphanomyces astaci]
MKLLAALVHATAASELVFDSLAPLGDTGTTISKDKSVGVQFRTPHASSSASLVLDYVNFTLRTAHIPSNVELWLRADFFRTIYGPKSRSPSRIPIRTFAQQATYQWVPDSRIVLEPNTNYWFTVHSNGETKDELPIWLDGAKKFSTANDPLRDVAQAYTKTERGPWSVLPLSQNRTVPSLQVYAKYNA